MEILMATTRRCQFFCSRRRRHHRFVLFSKLFCSLEMIHILVTCVYIVTCFIYILFVHRRQIVSADAARGVSKDSKTIYGTPMESKFGMDFM